jgi:hypothetical protein
VIAGITVYTRSRARQCRSLSRRTFRIAPFQQKRYANSDENESPNQNGVQVDHAHCCQQKSDASDQKKWGSDSAVKGAISKPVGEAADGHRETARRRGRRVERSPIDSYQAQYSPCNKRDREPVAKCCWRATASFHSLNSIRETGVLKGGISPAG